MAKLILIPAAQTDWHAQGRLAGDLDLPLNEYGHCQAVASSQDIAGLAPRAIHCGPEQATKQTATIIAHELNIKLQTSNDLREMNLGHWEGLTTEAFRERFGKVYRQWRNDPMSVAPPEGEALGDVAKRLGRGVEKIIRRYAGRPVAITLGRFAHAVVVCQLRDHDFTRFWRYVDGEATWQAIDTAELAGFVSAANRPVGHDDQECVLLKIDQSKKRIRTR